MSARAPLRRKVRCAVYTRKSHEEGLELEFNSLHAQREACEAYIVSQRQEGWVLVPDQYDDGGISGGTLERPALKRLLRDIEAGLVDVVVVYKVDRLSRSLTDFAKLVDAFDRHEVSFVSITQQFNTTTSMGRLTLNILLSFAQFEREVIGERIRDKFAASRKKGMWMGGPIPLGYDVVESQAGGEPGRGQAGAPDLQALCGAWVCHLAGEGASRAGLPVEELGHAVRPASRRSAFRQGGHLQASSQPGLSRRGGAQGHELSRRARPDRRPEALGPGARDPVDEWSFAGKRHPGADAGGSAGPDPLRPLREGDDPQPHAAPGAALPLLRLHRQPQARRRHLPRPVRRRRRDRAAGAGPGPPAPAVTGGHLAHHRRLSRPRRRRHGSAADREREVTDAFGRLEAVWEELYPAEQARIVQLLVDGVDVDPGGVDVHLRSGGLRGLAQELMAATPEAAAKADEIAA